MKLIKHIILLWTLSLLAHLITQTVLFKVIEYDQHHTLSSLVIIITILATIILSYFLLRHQYNKQRPKFSVALLSISISQCLTIISLTIYYSIKQTLNFTPDSTAIALGFDYIDFIIKVIVLAFALPLIIVTPIYLLDRRSVNNYS